MREKIAKTKTETKGTDGTEETVIVTNTENVTVIVTGVKNVTVVVTDAENVTVIVTNAENVTVIVTIAKNEIEIDEVIVTRVMGRTPVITITSVTEVTRMNQKRNGRRMTTRLKEVTVSKPTKDL